MAEFRWEMSVDKHHDNMYTIIKDGMVIGKIFLLNEGEGHKAREWWTGWKLDGTMVCKKEMWIDALNEMRKL